jgi:hypothetical protein
VKKCVTIGYAESVVILAVSLKTFSALAVRSCLTCAGREYSVSRHCGEVPVFGKLPRRALGCHGVGKTLAFYGVEAGRRGKEIETVTVGVAGDDSRGAAGNFDDIGVGHESFLPRASLKSS